MEGTCGFCGEWAELLPVTETVPCQFVYRSKECNYRGNIADCDKTFDGPRGCHMHGNERRFNGHPSVGPPMSMCAACLKVRPWYRAVK